MSARRHWKPESRQVFPGHKRSVWLASTTREHPLPKKRSIADLDRRAELRALPLRFGQYDYGPIAATVTYRRGIGTHMTLEGHAGHVGGLTMAAGGVTSNDRGANIYSLTHPSKRLAASSALVLRTEFI